jgi:hypothetical protein
MVRAVLALLLVATPLAGEALSIVFDFEKAVQSAAVVAHVKIERGELNPANDGGSCGARYTARVLTPVKGVRAGETIEFGYFLGHKVGAEYVVFLQSRESILAHTEGRKPPPMVSPVPYLRTCRHFLAPLLEVAEGVGTIPVGHSSMGERGAVVKLTNTPYLIPERMPGTRMPKGFVADGVFFGTQETPVAQFCTYLVSLQGSRQ